MEDSDEVANSGGAELSWCVGCGNPILDQFVLRVAPNLRWHAACLKCHACQRRLDETNTCFVRDRLAYCRQDYVRLFGAACRQCKAPFTDADLVVRVRGDIYHVDCFRCVVCQRPLRAGDEFALRPDGPRCREDHTANIERGGRPGGMGEEGGRAHRERVRVERNEADGLKNGARGEGLPSLGYSLGVEGSDGRGGSGGLRVGHGLRVIGLVSEISSATEESGGDMRASDGDGSDSRYITKRDILCAGGESTISPQSSSSSSLVTVHSTTPSSSSSFHQDLKPSDLASTPTSRRSASGYRTHRSGGGQKSTRIRTVMSELQLHTLRTCYAANPRPDALIKEQLVEMTGLSSRVIRVWFQNKRCKDKKRTILLKQIQDQQASNDKGSLQVASSPVLLSPPSPPLEPTPVELHEAWGPDLPPKYGGFRGEHHPQEGGFSFIVHSLQQQPPDRVTPGGGALDKTPDRGGDILSSMYNNNYYKAEYQGGYVEDHYARGVYGQDGGQCEDYEDSGRLCGDELRGAIMEYGSSDLTVT